MKIRPVGAEQFHANGRMDIKEMTKLKVASRKFANAPKKLRKLQKKTDSSLANIWTFKHKSKCTARSID
jgi:hypothetical protein